MIVLPDCATVLLFARMSGRKLVDCSWCYVMWTLCLTAGCGRCAARQQSAQTGDLRDEA